MNEKRPGIGLSVSKAPFVSIEKGEPTASDVEAIDHLKDEINDSMAKIGEVIKAAKPKGK
jgi:hypothetical protein